MTLKMDKAGRVILPKPVRDRLGLRAGSDLEILETPVLVAELNPSLIRKGSFLVYAGEIPPGFDAVEAIREEREERMQKIWGV
jgi:AbrB family looped-hinge helix DNA binding protein